MITIDTHSLAKAIAAELWRLQQAEKAPPPKTHETAAEFASRLGVSLRQIRKWIGLGLPSLRVGRVRRVIVADAERWLADGNGNGASARLGTIAARRAALRSINGGSR